MDLISLSVEVDEHTRKHTYEVVSLWAATLTETHNYVNVNSISREGFDADDEESEVVLETCDRVHLHCDDQTMIKVRAAILNGLTDPVQATLGGSESPSRIVVDNIVNRLQNAGVLFHDLSNY